GPCSEAGAGGDTETNTNLVTVVADQELLSTQPAPPPPKELVIPLILPHHRKNPELPRADTTPATAEVSRDPPSVEARAAQELLQEAQESQEQPEGRSRPPISIPLQLPDKDVATGLQLTRQDYEAVPVGQFGLAMLWGMGWRHAQEIRHTFPRVVYPLEHQPRLRGLGLGAEPP
ncbi:GPKOW protein, partial [Ptilonorhynchus violaceus]|nr:GPKOW protein [Ptilonorhynchus violaceus]